MYNVKLGPTLSTIFAVEKQRLLNTLSVCIYRLKYSAWNGHTICSSASCPALQYVSTFSHKWYDFIKYLVTKNVCFDFLYNVCP
jgi:hypothetical protein